MKDNRITQLLQKNYTQVKFKGIMQAGGLRGEFFITQELAGYLLQIISKHGYMNKKEFKEFLVKNKFL